MLKAALTDCWTVLYLTADYVSDLVSFRLVRRVELPVLLRTSSTPAKLAHYVIDWHRAELD